MIKPHKTVTIPDATSEMYYWSVIYSVCVSGGSGSCPLGAACSVVGPAGDIYASSARERGHYVAYEPLGHYTQ